MISIDSWLKNPDFKTGVQLYLVHGKSDTLKKLFQAGPTAFSRQKLVEELAKLVEVKTETKAIAPSKQDKDFKPVPDWAVESQKAQIELLKERDSLRGQLHSAKTDAERLELSLRILELGDQILEIGLEQKEYKETGKVPTRQAIKENAAYHWLQMDDISIMEYYYNSFNPRLSRARKSGNEQLLEEMTREQAALKSEIEKRRRK